jgi:hypothetical protein
MLHGPGQFADRRSPLMLQAQSTKAGETALAGAVEFFRGCWFGVWFFGGNCCDWGQDLLLWFQLEIHRLRAQNAE